MYSRANAGFDICPVVGCTGALPIAIRRISWGAVVAGFSLTATWSSTCVALTTDLMNIYFSACRSTPWTRRACGRSTRTPTKAGWMASRKRCLATASCWRYESRPSASHTHWAGPVPHANDDGESSGLVMLSGGTSFCTRTQTSRDFQCKVEAGASCATGCHVDGLKAWSARVLNDPPHSLRSRGRSASAIPTSKKDRAAVSAPIRVTKASPPIASEVHATEHRDRRRIEPLSPNDARSSRMAPSSSSPWARFRASAQRGWCSGRSE